jgi:hypothetical protein
VDRNLEGDRLVYSFEETRYLACSLCITVIVVDRWGLETAVLHVVILRYTLAATFAVVPSSAFYDGVYDLIGDSLGEWLSFVVPSASPGYGFRNQIGSSF